MTHILNVMMPCQSYITEVYVTTQAQDHHTVCVLSFLQQKETLGLWADHTHMQAPPFEEERHQ